MGSNEQALDAEQFWRFSCAIYAEPEIADTCLALQDSYDLNVNLLLLAVWLGRQQIALSTNDFSRLTGAISPWQQAHLLPIRALRRQIGSECNQATADLQPAVEQLYGQLKQAELSAEKIQQQQLIASMAEPPLPIPAQRSTANALANLHAYIDSRQLVHTPELLASLKMLA